MAKTMLKYSKLSNIFWVQAVHIAVHILNIGMLKSNSDKTPYELWNGRLENVKQFKVFGSKSYIKREDGRLGKFESRIDKGLLVGYSRKRKVYKCFSPRLNRNMETINVRIDETGVRKRKRSKDSEEQDNKEDLKEEVEEEEQSEAEQ
jgi:hypothetical protein